jgi:hypothetical protein
VRDGRSPRRVPSLLAGARFATWPPQAAWLHRVHRGIDELPVVVSGAPFAAAGCVAVLAGVRGQWLRHRIVARAADAEGAKRGMSRCTHPAPRAHLLALKAMPGRRDAAFSEPVCVLR